MYLSKPSVRRARELLIKFWPSLGTSTTARPWHSGLNHLVKKSKTAEAEYVGTFFEIFLTFLGGFLGF
jgi:hypothetical protein